MIFDTEAFQLLQTLFNNLLAYLVRPDVLRQVGLACAIWLITLFPHRLLRRFVESRLPAEQVDEVDHRRYWAAGVKHLWNRVVKPIIMLGLLLIAIELLNGRGILTGLLSDLVSIVLFYLLAQLLITALYTFGNTDYVWRFTTRFLWPVFILFVLWRLLDRLISVSTFMQSELITLFGSAITVSGALIATVGLYLWITGANLLNDSAVTLLTRRRQDMGSIKATFTLIRYLFIIVGIGIAISQLNFNATTIAAITGGLSVGVGFALSTILSNFISGLILLFERSIEPGDVIEVDDKLSIVEDVSMRAMRVRTLNNIEVVIPNETFMSSSFTTYTGSDKRIRVQLPVGAGYDDDPAAVEKVLIEIAQKHEKVLQNPAPTVFLAEFGDSSVNYYLNAWLASPLDRPQTVSDLNNMVYAAFDEHGFSIPFPQRDLHIIPSPDKSD